jgi:5-methylcytosine-specific restriction endonuclease McrA
MRRKEYQHLYKTAAWRELRAAQLNKHPLCQRCLRHGYVTPASVVHHKTAHKGDEQSFRDANNLESLCAACHNSVEQSIERRGFDKSVGNDGWPVDSNHKFNSGAMAPEEGNHGRKRKNVKGA